MKFPAVVMTILFSGTLLSAGAQDLTRLDQNNGFKSYKLGSRYDVTLGVKVKQEDMTDKVTINYTRDKIGDISIKQIDLTYIKDTLVKIVVTVEPDQHEPLLSAMKNSFGEPTKDLSDNEATRKAKKQTGNLGNYMTDRYLWETTKLNLEYNYYYPQYSGGAGSIKRLFIAYSLNSFAQRLERMKESKYSAKDF